MRMTLGRGLNSRRAPDAPPPPPPDCPPPLPHPARIRQDRINTAVARNTLITQDLQNIDGPHYDRGGDAIPRAPVISSSTCRASAVRRFDTSETFCPPIVITMMLWYGVPFASAVIFFVSSTMSPAA